MLGGLPALQRSEAGQLGQQVWQSSFLLQNHHSQLLSGSFGLVLLHGLAEHQRHPRSASRSAVSAELLAGCQTASTYPRLGIACFEAMQHSMQQEAHLVM